MGFGYTDARSGNSIGKWMVAVPQALLLGLIRVYQLLLAPVLPGSCRYEPGCSSYAMQAIRRFGPFAGGWLGLKRILRCHPWGSAGYDPVPEGVAGRRPRLDERHP
jgi:putative membrane protein insertion efficiency factor